MFSLLSILLHWVAYLGSYSLLRFYTPTDLAFYSTFLVVTCSCKSETSQAVHSVTHRRSLTFLTTDFINLWLLIAATVLAFIVVVNALYLNYLERTTANTLNAIELQHTTTPHGSPA